MENTNKEFSLTLNKLQVQILGGVTAVLILIGSISTIALINTLRNNHNDFMDGMEIGKEEAYKQVQETASYTIELAQQVITEMNAISIPNVENENPTDGEDFAFIDSEDRWNN